MIVPQSSATILLSCPLGTFGNSPAIYGWVHGSQLTQSPGGTTEILPCLTGLKYRIPDFTIRFCDFASSCGKSVFIGVHPWLKNTFLPNEPISKMRNYLKINKERQKQFGFVFQSEPYFSGYLWAFKSASSACSNRNQTHRPNNPNHKSTPCYRKSIVDLGEEPLIWGKNGLQTSAFAVGRHSFRPIMTRELKRANQKQTEAGQKRIMLTVDLGCETRGRIKPEMVPGYVSSGFNEQFCLTKTPWILSCLARF
jgi:hypothetical protein